MRRNGDRKLQILQTLAAMLENPVAIKITTASIATQVGVSEAALYRHFNSKAEIFEGLIEFIEQTLFSLINRIMGEETPALTQLEATIKMLLGFAERNRGLTRVLTGDALVNEDERLQLRINQLLSRLETTLRHILKHAASHNEVQPELDIAALANLLISFVQGRWQQFANTGFVETPLAYWPTQWEQLQQGIRMTDKPATIP